MKVKMKLPKAEDVIKFDKKTNKVTLGGVVITQTEITNLKSEVQAFKSFRLRKVFYETLKQYAIEMGFNESQTWEETLAGKMLAYAISIQENTEKIIEKM